MRKVGENRIDGASNCAASADTAGADAKIEKIVLMVLVLALLMLILLVLMLVLQVLVRVLMLVQCCCF